MKLKKVALITEIVGGAGILVTLIILVFEVRENNSLADRQIRLDRANARAALAVNSPYIPTIIAKIKAVDIDAVSPGAAAFMDRYDLTYEEANRFSTYLRRQWRGNEADYYAGTPDLDRTVRQQLNWPDQKLYWEHARPGFSEEFVTYVHSLSP